MHYLDVRKKRSRNEFEEDIDRELEWKQRNLSEKWKGKMGLNYLYLTSKDYSMKENEDKKDEDL